MTFSVKAEEAKAQVKVRRLYDNSSLSLSRVEREVYDGMVLKKMANDPAHSFSQKTKTCSDAVRAER